VLNKSGSTIAQGALVRPDPANVGCVKAATSASDGPIIGRVNDGVIPNNTSGRVYALLGGL
jgi:hypothetical protein